MLSGESPEKVIQALGFHRSCIDDCLSRYEQGGGQALSTGKITGRPRNFPMNMRIAYVNGLKRIRCNWIFTMPCGRAR
ncbi:MAG: hypothetical protein GKR94_34845 [Gammaproteobacteria bacterium]|nr:hypothetical protein [Gammaproteobacteria bacterium]NKC11867.1 hypothetical protein [Gammaproteobacteria bacterium]NKC11905.1 hypothetical protein [Gammaproteobacteria bacterium]NKC12670.1 hypothetical protein [Gammaproteobacteria bacterium]NKC17191.1 hypothetical protein [Gammaproteobacteria bacterium]